MISFELTEEQEIVRATLGEFAAEAVAPEARRLDEAARIDVAMFDRLWATGVIPAQADRAERSAVSNALILEELGAADATVAAALACGMGFVQAIADQGTPAQRDALLPGLTGDAARYGVIALAEKTFGSDVSRPTTTAARDGQDFVLQGTKALVPLADGATHFLVVASLEGAADAFIVPADSAGVTIAAAEGTLGLRGLAGASVTFDGVVVPGSMRLGENGADVQRIVDGARIAAAAVMTGLSRAVRDYVIPYTKERVVHGVPLAQKQAVAFNIADMAIEVDAMRWMTWQAAWAIDAGQPATKLAQLAFTYAGTQTMEIADDGVQMLGGYGFVREHPMEMWYRNARSLSVMEGIGGV